jgi:glycosyltransferase involved in cell wall biosynthesis
LGFDLSSTFLSICIPTFNRSKKIEQIINELLVQCEGLPVEIVVSDNGSDDGTRELCTGIAARNRNFRFIAQGSNLGFARNLDACLLKGNGRYLWMLGDDDLLYPDAVKTVVETLKRHYPAWLLCNFSKISSREDSLPVVGFFKVPAGERVVSIDEMLGIVGVWSSFMSINIIDGDVFRRWRSTANDPESDYYGFEVALNCGANGKGMVLQSPLIGRVMQPLKEHRFGKLDVYLFDFFDPLDRLVEAGKISRRMRVRLSEEMFFSMAAFLLLRNKLSGQKLPPIRKCIAYHAQSPLFWMVIMPVILSPKWLLRSGLWILSFLTPRKSESKIRQLIESLNM